MEDVFLDEALEGYRRFSQSDHQERLDRIREHLQTKTKKRTGPPAPLFYRIAAAAAILLVVGLFWWLNPLRTADLAEAAPEEGPVLEQEASTTSDSMISATEEAESSGNESVTAGGPAAADRPNRFRPGPVLSPPSTTTEEKNHTPAAAGQSPAAPEPAIAENAAEESLALRSTPRDREKLRATAPNNTDLPAPPLPPPPAQEEKTRDYTLGGVKLNAAQGTRLVTGQVLDRSGAPVEGVLVVTPGDRTGTITNAEGQYEILLDSNTRKLEFQRAGFSPEQIDLTQSTDFVKITLEKVAEADTAEMSTLRQAPTPSVSGSPANPVAAEPRGGYDRFERQLRRELQYPQQAIERGISGEVVLRFKVLSNGLINDIEVLQTPGGGIDQEARRLLTTGPRWRLTDSTKDQAIVTYRFDFSL